MAYDESLASRVLDLLEGQPDLEQKKMFGGISYMVRGHFCCGIVKDDLCVRVGPDVYDDALAQPHVREMDFTGRPMAGWVFVGPGALESDDDLGAWVGRGLSHALSLPPK